MSNNLAISVDSGVSLAHYTSEDLLIPQLRERDLAGVIQELSQRLHQAGHVPDMLPFYHAALNREFLVSTALEYGMAFPHARLHGLPRLCFALGRSAAPIAWGVQNTIPVRLVFLLTVPATEATGYLYIVSGLSRLGKDRQRMKALLAAGDPGEMLAALRHIKLPQMRNGPS